MKKLLTITDQTFDQNAPEFDASNFRHRQAVRCVVFDSKGKVGLIHSKKHDYYKIAGGGVDKGESRIEALKRETKEELGVNIEIDGQIGEIFEIRGELKLLQTSYCYYGHVVGEKGRPNFTGEEITEQFETVWAPNIDAAIELAAPKSSDRKRYEQPFMVLRDETFLREAKKILAN
ncbi:NUDIX hydrolase [Candidatus Saccharibacteria bacterium]|nr:NUDIX hydrolase [Candidatus Saccharibacteria bacterium]